MVRLELKVDVIGRGQWLKIRLRVRTGKDGVAVRVNSKRKGGRVWQKLCRLIRAFGVTTRVLDARRQKQTLPQFVFLGEREGSHGT